MIVGVDEVGRGCWAGPVVAGAVILGSPISGLKDSKKLSRIQRERLNAEIQVSALQLALGWVPAKEIDSLGMTEAVRLAMKRAIDAITLAYDELILDGAFNFFKDNSRCIAVVGADNSVPAVSAASIIAKVARDRYMYQMSSKFPGYGFDKHVGYGTAAHRAGIDRQGVCELHRLSFKPLQIYKQK